MVSFLLLTNVAMSTKNVLEVNKLYDSLSAAAWASKHFAVWPPQVSPMTFLRSRSSITCSITLYTTDGMPLSAFWRNLNSMSSSYSFIMVANSFATRNLTAGSLRWWSRLHRWCGGFPWWFSKWTARRGLRLPLQQVSMRLPQLTPRPTSNCYMEISKCPHRLQRRVVEGVHGSFGIHHLHNHVGFKWVDRFMLFIVSDILGAPSW